MHADDLLSSEMFTFDLRLETDVLRNGDRGWLHNDISKDDKHSGSSEGLRSNQIYSEFGLISKKAFRRDNPGNLFSEASHRADKRFRVFVETPSGLRLLPIDLRMFGCLDSLPRTLGPYVPRKKS